MESERQKEEKEARRRKNLRERRVMERYEREGWTLTTRGFPTFIARNLAGGRPLRAVFVPRKGGLTKAQDFMKSILDGQKIDTYVEAE
jgi:hypothetical protein